MSLEMAHKVILPPQKNYIPQFLKQRDINSYFLFRGMVLERNSENFLICGSAGIRSEQTICLVYSVFQGIIFWSEIPNP
jgi:hypothetical protein